MTIIDAMSLPAMGHCGASCILKCGIRAASVFRHPLWPHGLRTALALAPMAAYLAGVLYLFL